ncbi:MAG: 13E12 repeat family protein, partial [Actinomycetota bacterium]|nr:13E12 repeat family protein [Actinomycetota bacterium]
MTTLIGDHDVELWALTDGQLTAEVESALRARASLDEWCARLVGAAADRDLARLAGATSTAVWLKNLAGISRPEAHRLVKRSELLCEEVEEIRKVWAAGTVSTDQATVICEALVQLPEWVGDQERGVAQGKLLEWALDFGLDDLKRLANRILEVVDPDGVDEHLGKQLDTEEQIAHGRTELSMWSAGDGMTRGRFQLPTVQAGILKTVLEGLASPRRNDPAIYDRDGEHSDAATGTLTHAQKLGRAFCELLEHLPSEAMPQHGGLAASVTITMTVDQLNDGLG